MNLISATFTPQSPKGEVAENQCSIYGGANIDFQFLLFSTFLDRTHPLFYYSFSL